MAKLTLNSQDKIAETMLTALSARATEAGLPNPLLHDKTAQQMIEQIDYDFNRLKLNKLDQIATILRVRQFDRFTQDFLRRHPFSVVVQIGCGLDTRFERVNNQQVEWYDLDLPEVIEFRVKLVPETERYHMLGYSVFDQAWVDMVSNHPGRDYLFLAEGVFPYFTEPQVKALFLLFLEKFSGCELVCDAMTPAMIWLHNLELRSSKIDARLNWGLKNGNQPEAWSDDICLINEWFYFNEPEPRMGSFRLMRYLPVFAKGVGIYHYQLGRSTN